MPNKQVITVTSVIVMLYAWLTFLFPIWGKATIGGSNHSVILFVVGAIIFSFRRYYTTLAGRLVVLISSLIIGYLGVAAFSERLFHKALRLPRFTPVYPITGSIELIFCLIFLVNIWQLANRK